jgi:NOL1/NOP2/sun family putative RNA methylase
MKLPEFFLNHFRTLMDHEEFNAFVASFDGSRHYGLRLNTLKVNKDDFLKLTHMKLSEIPWVSEGFYYEEGDVPGKHPYYHAGLYYIQEPSAMMPARMLSPCSGERVLDLCAAPGGKTTQLGSFMKNKGLIVCNDISPKRVKALVKNVELMGLTNTLVTNETPQRLAETFPEFFDKILLDVPCSGEGMFRKDREAVQSYTRFKSTECVAMQRDIMEKALTMLRPGGSIVYSTCTFNPEENERNIEDFMARYGLTVKRLVPSGGWEPSRSSWTESGDEALSGGLRMWPHRGGGEGHFVCRLEKSGEAAGSASRETLYADSEYTSGISDFTDNSDSLIGKSDYTSPEAEKAASAFFGFISENMRISLSGVYHLRGGSLYLLPPYLDTAPALRWEKAGLYLGEYQKGRFEPSQSLVMACRSHHFKRVISFKADDHNVLRYLKGETLMTDGDKGYTLVCVDGFPLGWAKQENGILKNLYPKGWRMM